MKAWAGEKNAKRQRGQWFIFLLLLRVCGGEITKGFTFLEEKQNADIEGYCMEGMSVSWKACETTQEERGLYLGESLYFYVSEVKGLGERGGEHEKMRTASFSENTNITVTLSFRIRNKTWSPFYSHLMNWHINSFHVFLGHFLLLNISCKSWDRSFLCIYLQLNSGIWLDLKPLYTTNSTTYSQSSEGTRDTGKINNRLVCKGLNTFVTFINTGSHENFGMRNQTSFFWAWVGSRSA